LTELLWLAPTALVVGILVGATGIGGILLIPALAALAGLPLREAMATALFTFAFMGIAGTVAYQRRGSLDWSISGPVCIGAALSAFAGARLNAVAPVALLAALLAGLIIFAGVYTLAPWHGRSAPLFHDNRPAQRITLVTIGAAAGFAAGLTGIGGPALSLPLMVLAGFPILASVGTAQVIQIAAAGSGTLANLHYGSVNFTVGLPVLVLEMAGVMLGARLAHAMNPSLLRRLVAVLCIAIGIFLLIRAGAFR